MIFLFLMGSLITCQAAGKSGTFRMHPYQRISRRNIFKLRPPPAPVTDQTLLSPPATITLNGITTILGDKRALLNIHLAARSTTPAHDEPCILKEGQQDQGVRILGIDIKPPFVKVNNSGIVQVLTFETNGPQLAPGSLRASTQRAPTRPAIANRTPGMRRWAWKPQVPQPNHVP